MSINLRTKTENEARESSEAKMVKNFSIGIKRFFDKEENELVLEISIPQELRDILREGISTDSSLKETTHVKSVIGDDNEDSRVEYVYHQRYRVRTILINSINSSDGWSWIHELFFCKDLIDDGTLKIICSNVTTYSQISQRSNHIKSLIQAIYSIKVNETKTFNVSVSEVSK